MQGRVLIKIGYSSENLHSVSCFIFLRPKFSMQILLIHADLWQAGTQQNTDQH